MDLNSDFSIILPEFSSALGMLVPTSTAINKKGNSVNPTTTTQQVGPQTIVTL